VTRHPTNEVLWSYAGATLAVHRRAKVRAHAVTCSRCSRQIQEALAARRALAGGEIDAPAAQELASWGEEILYRHEDRATTVRWPWAAALATALTVLIAVIWLPRSHRGDDELVARGGARETALHVRVLCIAASDGEHVDIADTQGTCPGGAYLKILVGNHHSRRTKLAVVVMTDRGPSSLYPNEFSHELLDLPETLGPLPGSMHLSHEPGVVVRVAVLALDEPRLAADDPLVGWLRSAAPGAFTDVLTRADAVITDVLVGRGEEP
jgi:hypothetical protein